MQMHSTLRKLPGFLQGDDRPFRMLVEVIAGTVHLIRRENTPTHTEAEAPLINAIVAFFLHTLGGAGAAEFELLRRNKVRIFRDLRQHLVVVGPHTAMTPVAVALDRGTLPLDTGMFPLGIGNFTFTGSQRFGTGNLLLLSTGNHSRLFLCTFGTARRSLYIKSDKTPLKTSNKADLLDLLGGLQVDRAGKATSSDDSESILHVGNAGEEVKQEQVFDLKTRSVKRQAEDILAEEMPRLWIAQIPNFILAFHDRGHFANVQIQNVRDKLKDWEAQNQSLLRGFFHLLGHIIDTAGDYGDSQLEIVQPAEGGLEIRKRAPDVGSVLSGPVRQSWAKWLSDGEDAGQDEKAASLDVHTAKETSSEDDTACDEECGYCGKCAY